MSKGLIIYLEGTSSSGKTTLAKALQSRLPKPYFWLASDTFWEMALQNHKYDNDVLFKKIEIATIKTIKLFSDLGIDVIVDTVPVSISNSMDLHVNTLHEYPVLYVCVTCPLAELRRREKERGDRIIGTAERQLALIAPITAYDIVVDTHENSIEECADKIINLLDCPEKFTAFKTLWTQRNV